MPTHRVDTLKERVLHPFRRIEYRRFEALRSISFDIGDGEFFGIVGRNGCGKTTLLKLLASIYRADGGSIKTAGRLSPFIELGVGFNPNMTARENVLLNGVMLGLTPREARRRFDEVIEFAELQDFVEMKLKNYSSGMSVRLGFSVMIQADADILLIDEVLAVGDASFQAKCTDTFERLNREGKTVVLVTHDMSSVKRFCDRAMLLHEGKVTAIGDPTEVAESYTDVNLPRMRRRDVEEGGMPAHIAEVRVGDGSGAPAEGFARGERITLGAVIEAEQSVERPAVGVELRSQQGTRVYSSGPREIGGGRMMAGERRHIRFGFENPLASGRYHVLWALYADPERGKPPVEVVSDPAGLVIADSDTFVGLIELDPDWSVEGDPDRDLAHQ